MSNTKIRIQEHTNLIQDIFDISQCPALSIGVLHNGKIIHTAHYGTREVGKQLPPNDDTIYRVASLTKVLTASAVAALVDDGKLDLDTPIREYLPEFRARKDDIGLKANLRDLLCNRTGLAAGDCYWGQQYGEFLLPHNELVNMAVHTPAVKPFRKKFVYAGWNYGLITEVVETVAGMTLGQFLKERFFGPLGLNRTTLGDTYDSENIALGYGLDTDGSYQHIPFQQMNDGIGLAGAYGCKSSIKDLLLMYKGLLRAQQDQVRSGLHKSPESPFTHTQDIFKPHINVFGSTSYCLGLYKTTLPGLLGIASLNTISWLGPRNSPIMEPCSENLEVWHHTGTMPNCLASAFLVPETQSAVVAIASSIGFMDPSDFVAQQLLAIVIGAKLDRPLITLAKAAKASNISQYPELHAKLLKNKTGKCSRATKSYEGSYWNAAGNFCLTITQRSEKGLRMKVQDVPRTGYDLVPYDEDTWWWPPDRRLELCERGSAAFMHPGYHLILFRSSTGQQIDELSWHHDPTASPETFYRQNKKPQWKGYPFPKAKL